MLANRIYHKVLEEGRKGATIFLDLGCCSESKWLLTSLHIVTNPSVVKSGKGVTVIGKKSKEGGAKKGKV